MIIPVVIGLASLYLIGKSSGYLTDYAVSVRDAYSIATARGR